MSLRHIAIPWRQQRSARIYPSYALATRVQSVLQERLLAWKNLSVNGDSDKHDPPPPSLISFTPAPTYTLGRRQTEPLSADELARLQAPLILGKPAGKRVANYTFTPEVVHTARGGLMTYHGPKQVVLWPVMDLRSPLHENFTVREYVRLLEDTTIATLKGLYDVDAFSTPDPGVWVRQPAMGNEEKKIAALGVHLRRHVTGLGVAINVGMPVTGSEDENPWARIVACGLGDKGVTTVAASVSEFIGLWRAEQDITVTWANEFAARLRVSNGAKLGSDPLVTQSNWRDWETSLQVDRAREFVTAEITRR
ncbi:hypothetical protein F5Y05DRAFT_291594 [Hypoxylon sp. FL0543]|nr:hypothetical protein F5Y05DRAFT_291594 [Hypoxylon sp. FL0543]